MLTLTGIDLSRCPCCKQGTMVIVAELLKLRPWDSSRKTALTLEYHMDQRGECARVCFSLPSCLALVLQRYP